MTDGGAELGDQIDLLRRGGSHNEADALQFDEGRCRACGQLAGGDRRHRCWVGGAPAMPEIVVTVRTVPDTGGPQPGEHIGDHVRITRCPEDFAYVGAEGKVVDIITGGVWVVELAHRQHLADGWMATTGQRVAALAVEVA